MGRAEGEREGVCRMKCMAGKPDMGSLMHSLRSVFWAFMFYGRDTQYTDTHRLTAHG